MTVTYLIDFSDDRGVEQPVWRRMSPILEIVGELGVREMPYNAGHRHITMAPGATKIKTKRVIFDIGISRGVLLNGISNTSRVSLYPCIPVPHVYALPSVWCRRTSGRLLPSRWMASPPHIGPSCYVPCPFDDIYEERIRSRSRG
jgi:hypothetical protein